jgi:2'-5' RNA ligase
MRLFVGIAASTVIKEKVKLWQGRNQREYFRLTPPENLHITLVPPWYTDNSEEAIEKLNHLNFFPINIMFNRISTNPGRSLIWAEAGQVPQELVQLQQICEERFGVKPEKRLFRPHLTLARFKNRRSEGAWTNETIVWPETLDNVTLYESVLSSSGAVYRVVSQRQMI